MKDTEIIDMLNARDEQSINKLSDKYGDYCFMIAYNILSDKLDSEECVNDTWMNTWNSIPPKRPNSLKLFLSAIVRNLSFDRFRRKHREKRGGDGITLALEEIEEMVAGSREVEDEITEREMIECINRFMRSLGERERNIFLRRYYYVDRVSDIAVRFGTTDKNIFMILSRVRAKLRAHLEKEGYTV